MAYSAADISAQEISDAAADYPLVISRNVIELAKGDGSFAAEWRTSGSFASGADATDSDYPTTAAYDLHSHVDTRPDSSQTTWYLMFNLGATLNDISTAVIGGHNLGSNTATVDLEIADDNAFSTNLVSLVQWTPATDVRLVSVDLDEGANANARRISDAQFVRLKIVAGAGFVPQVGEVYLGDRRQLHASPLMGYNPDSTMSSVSDFVANSGVRTRHVWNRDQKVLSADMISSTAAQATTIKGWWDDSEQGSRPFYWIEEPATTPGDAALMFMSAATFPGGRHRSALARRYSFVMEECAPFYNRES